MKFSYPFSITKESENEFLVRFKDIPEALTSGESEEEAITMAKDSLIAALGGYIEDRLNIPEPSATTESQHMAILNPLESAKIGLYRVMLDQNISNVALASKLNMDEKAVRRMLDLDHNSKINGINDALKSDAFDTSYTLITTMEPTQKIARRA